MSLPVPPPFVLTLLLTVLFLTGAGLVVFTLLSAVRAIVLPRAERVALNNFVFRSVRSALYLLSKRAPTYAGRDRVMALIGPIGLLALPVVWLSLLSVGYTMAYYALGIRGWRYAYQISGNALLTLGAPDPWYSLGVQLLVVSEAALGLLLIALIVTYLPTIYTSFTRREAIVAQLELRAGLPASAGGLVCWLWQVGALRPETSLVGTEEWREWERWLMEIEESHTTLPVLSLFRSREAGRSWVTAVATVLDAAALIAAVVDAPRNPYRDLCFKAGVLAVNRVARFFENTSPPHQAHPHPAVAFERDAFQTTYAQLQDEGIPLKLPELEAWEAFNDLRLRYREALNPLANLAMAPMG